MAHLIQIKQKNLRLILRTESLALFDPFSVPSEIKHIILLVIEHRVAPKISGGQLDLLSTHPPQKYLVTASEMMAKSTQVGLHSS